MEVKITNKEALKALLEIKTYCAATNLDELNYVIEVIKKLQNAGIENALNADFSLLKK